MTNFDDVFEKINELNFALVRGTREYTALEKELKVCTKKSNFTQNGVENFGPFGLITLPYLKMGKITTLELFGLDELLLFSWYKKNNSSYSNVGDLGANVGLHSILMSKNGWSVNAYEADPETAKILEKNLKLNSIKDVNVYNLAVSSSDGKAQFIRVKDNLTGSHLAGAKKDPYGAMERFEVSTIAIKEIMSKCDFIKMDVEGSEASIISATDTNDWEDVDAVIEIGSKHNSEIIFKHLCKIGVNMYGQKNSWDLVKSPEQLPHHHTEGLVFCSMQRNFLENT